MKVEKNTVLRERQIALWLRHQREGKTSEALEDRAVEGCYSEGGPLDKSGEGLQWHLRKMKRRVPYQDYTYVFHSLIFAANVFIFC